MTAQQLFEELIKIPEEDRKDIEVCTFGREPRCVSIYLPVKEGELPMLVIN